MRRLPRPLPGLVALAVLAGACTYESRAVLPEVAEEIESSTLYSSDGTLVYTFHAEENRKVIPLEAIRSATSLGGNRAQAVEVRYRTPGGDDGTVLLLLRNADPFIHAVLARRTDAVV